MQKIEVDVAKLVVCLGESGKVRVIVKDSKTGEWRCNGCGGVVARESADGGRE